MARIGVTKVILSVVLALMLVLGVTGQALAAGSWSTQTVDANGSTGWRTSIAVDASNNPHIAYYAYLGMVRYSHWTGSAWDTTTVDTNLGGFDPGLGSMGTFMRTSLKLDASGSPRISYADNTSGTLKYAYWNGSAFVIETADSTPGVGWYASLALDTAGNPHISYYDFAGGHLKYASKSGSTWTTVTVDNSAAVGKWTSLAIGTDNSAHISYYDETNQQLKYARSNGSSWSIETADSTAGVALYTSIALDNSGVPHISFYAIPGALKYVSRSGGVWSAPEIVDSEGDTGWWSSLAIGTDDIPRIASFQYGVAPGEPKFNLRYAVRSGSSWLVETVDSDGDVGANASLALGANNQPHISYQDNTNLTLKYATSLGPTVITAPATNVLTSSATLNGQLVSLGTSSSVSVSFQWGTVSGNLTNETTPQIMSAPGAFHYDLGSLSANTTYYFRARAVGNGTGYGEERSLRTSPRSSAGPVVQIDIRPGSPQNAVNAGSHGVIQVAILSSSSFDATTVDVGSVRFGPGEASPVHSTIRDVNQDGLPDMVLQFRTADTGLTEEDTEATLTGMTRDGASFSGTGAVRIVPEGKGQAVGKENAPGKDKEPGSPANGQGNAPDKNKQSGNGGSDQSGNEGKNNAPGQNKSDGAPAQGKGAKWLESLKGRITDIFER